MLPEMIRIDEQDWEKRRELLADGWREIEVLERYEGECITDRIRTVGVRDIETVKAIAKSGFEYDRWHIDTEISKEEADNSKLTWLEERCREKPHTVYVKGTPVNGFVVVTPDRGDMIIELVSVAFEHRGNGIATALIRHAAHDTLAKNICAGTQMTNERAKALYESLGLKVVRRWRTFHK